MNRVLSGRGLVIYDRLRNDSVGDPDLPAEIEVRLPDFIHHQSGVVGGPGTVDNSRQWAGPDAESFGLTQLAQQFNCTVLEFSG